MVTVTGWGAHLRHYASLAVLSSARSFWGPHLGVGVSGMGLRVTQMLA